MIKINRVIREIVSGKGLGALAPMFVATISREQVIASRPARNISGAVNGVFREVVYRKPDMQIMRYYRETLYSQSVVEKILSQTPSLRSAVIMHSSDWLPADQVFSDMDCAITRASVVMKADTLDLPWSFNPNYMTSSSALTANPAPFPQSWTCTPTVTFTALRPMFNPTVQSQTAVGSVAVSALQSLSIKYEPVSASFTYSECVTALCAMDQQTIPFSDNSVPAVASSALINRPREVFPQSAVTTLAMRQSALLRRRLVFPQSPITIPAMTSSTLIGDTLTFPQSDMDVPTVQSFALVGREAWDGTVGIEHSAGSSMSTLIQSDPVRVQSKTDVGQSVVTALSATSYPAPGNLAGANVPTLVIDTVEKSPTEGIPKSYESLAFTSVNWLMGTKYPRPDDMVPVSRVAIVPEMAQSSLMSKVDPFPLSQVPLKGFAQSTVMGADYLPPDVLFKAGVFSKSVLSVVAMPAAYPKNGEPVSQIDASLIAGMSVSKTTYPDKGTSHSEVISGTVGQMVVSHEAYPDKDMPQSLLSATLAVGMSAVGDTSYPPKNAPRSALSAEQVCSFTLAGVNSYPPKDVVQSQALVAQILSTVAASAAYPGKDEIQSNLVTGCVAQTVMTRDDAMIGLPVFEVRHRPTVVTTIIYEES